MFVYNFLYIFSLLLGLMVSDEIVLINDIAIFELTWRQVQDLLKNGKTFSCMYSHKQLFLFSVLLHLSNIHIRITRL